MRGDFSQYIRQMMQDGSTPNPEPAPTPVPDLLQLLMLMDQGKSPRSMSTGSPRDLGDFTDSVGPMASGSMGNILQGLFGGNAPAQTYWDDPNTNVLGAERAPSFFENRGMRRRGK